MLKKYDKILYEALLEKKLISETTLEPLTREVDTSGESLQQILIKRNILNEKDILLTFADKLKVNYFNLKDITTEKSVIEKIPVKIASYYKFLPVALSGRVLTVAVSVPLDIKTQDEIRAQLGYNIDFALATSADISDGLKKYYGIGAETVDVIVAQQSSPEAQTDLTDTGQQKVEDIEKLAEDASVIKLVNQIILEAFKKRATDIHIEPQRDKVFIRYRIDGILYDTNVPPNIRNFLSAIISRIKIMSNLNIVERRLPQDGRAIVKTQEQVLDLRISTIPTPFGESVVIRILPTQMLFSLEKLGLSKPDLQIFETLVHKPHGIIFVTGPTGSGKTTTLYSCLSTINTKARKIITIEDPIEYEMQGIIQMQVMPEIGLSFARGLRSILRHDPDVIMVGEVRDLETAEIAIRVALTGHLIFSTLHTNDAASGVTRLVDIGVEPYLVASSVEAFIAQRLIRVICPECKYEDKLALQEIKDLIAKDLGIKSAKVRIFRGKGCANCNSTGFFGRTAIYEMLLVDDKMRDLILKKMPSNRIKDLALSKGMRTLRQDGWQKVVSGQTTPEEVMEVTPSEGRQEMAAKSVAYSYPASASESEVQFFGIERRAYSRINNKINIRYKAFESTDELFKKGLTPEQLSVTKNISAGGMLFVSETPLPIGAIIELKVELSDNEETIECLARVVRIEEEEAEKVYNIAVCFLDITSAQRVRLNKYITTELKE